MTQTNPDSIALRLDWPLLKIVALGLVLRLLVMIALPQLPFSDGSWYVDRAQGIVDGLGYSENGHPTAFWPAGYPVLLAATMHLFGPNLFGAMLINLIATAVTVWLVGWFGQRVSGQRRVGQVASLLYALYPAHIAYTGAPMPEVVSTALLMGAIAMMMAARRRASLALLAGLVFGAATLIRAQFLYVPAGIAVALAVLPTNRSWRRAAVTVVLVYAGTLIAIAPLTIRNHAVLGEWVMISTNGGVALRTGAADDATGDHLDWNAARWNREGIPFDQRVERQVEADRHFRASATRWIAEHPVRWAMLMPVKAATLWVKDTDAFWGLQLSYPALMLPILAVSLVNQLFYLGILILALPALWAGLKGFWRGGEQRKLLFLFLIPAFVTLIAVVFTGQIRYHFPAMPFLFAAAAWTILRYRERVMSRVTGARASAT